MKIDLGTQIYNITFEPIKTKVKHKLPKRDFDLYIKLHKQVTTHPNEALEPLLELHNNYPQLPEITNLLTYLYFQKKELRKGEALIVENYKTNPDDLFAKINYADHCLRHKKRELIPEIFKGKFDLKLLYPSREIFHYSEVSGFAILMSYYHLAIGNRERALDFYKVAVQVDPHANGLDALEKRLFKENFFKKRLRFLNRFIHSCKMIFLRKQNEI